ncbi:MAG: hypothetical protein IKH97_01295 [Bacteroidales bacterium]|nr:hypothetical protein [Bacteroidales bacterium]
MKRTFIILPLLLTILAQSCNKRCQCIAYNGGTVEYSTEELDALGKTCSEMRYYDGLTTQRYTVCDWKY